MAARALVQGFFHRGTVDGRLVQGKARCHPQHVAIHRRGGQLKGDGADGAGGIVPHPGKRPDGVIVRGKHAAMLLHDDFGGLLEISHAAIVPQPLPELVAQRLVRRRQRLHRGKRREKPAIVALHRLHPGLLEHDLREPDVVGLPIPPPGKIPAVFLVPGQQQPRQGREVEVHQSSCRWATSPRHL